MKNWNNVFDNYPDVDQIYIVDDMPFLRADQAQAHGAATGKPVEPVSRIVQNLAADDLSAAEKADADLADADLAAAEKAADLAATILAAPATETAKKKTAKKGG